MDADCPHFQASRAKGLCLHCGQPVGSSRLEAYVACPGSLVRQYKVRQTIEELEREAVAGNKVLLFLDLDNTIVDARQCPSGAQDDTLEARQIYDKCDSLQLFAERLERRFSGTFKVMVEQQEIQVELRPGFLRFLVENAPRVILFIATLGTYEYATKVVQLFDPRFRLVRRILARVSTAQSQQLALQPKSLAAVIGDSPELLRRTLVFDDSSRPWAGQKELGFVKSVTFCQHVLTTEGPRFPLKDSLFQSFGLHTPSEEPTEARLHAWMTEMPQLVGEAQLAALGNVIVCIQQSTARTETLWPTPLSLAQIRAGAARAPSPDAEGFHVSALRRRVFEGCKFLVHSAVVQRGEARAVDMQDLRVQTILELGGTVAEALDDSVTHVVPGPQMRHLVSDKVTHIFQLYRGAIETARRGLPVDQTGRRIEVVPLGSSPRCFPPDIEALFRDVQRVWIVDSYFIFASAYLLRRQPEIWWLIQLVELRAAQMLLPERRQ